MKNLLFIIWVCIMATCLPACEKNDPPQEPKVEPAIVSKELDGTWEIRERWPGDHAAPFTFQPGNGDLLKFESGRYERYEKSILVKKGSYTIVADSTVGDNVCLVLPKGSYPARITYDNDLTKPKSFFEIKNGRLTFISGCYAFDAGHTDTYVMVK